jgi:hypothetical protein
MGFAIDGLYNFHVESPARKIDLLARLDRIDRLIRELINARGDFAQQHLLAGRLYREVTEARDAHSRRADAS